MKKEQAIRNTPDFCSNNCLTRQLAGSFVARKSGLFRPIHACHKAKHKKLRYAGGLSLIELLIYVAVLSVLLVGAVNVFLVVMRVRAHNNAKFAVNENARVVLGSIRDTLLDADSVSTGGSCPLNTLAVTTGPTTTTYAIANGAVQKTVNADQANTLTVANVTASTGSPCLFTKIDNPPPAQTNIQIKLRVASNASANSPSSIVQDYQLSVSLR
jgi:Tfp pilus assembly protein PilW